MTIKQWYDIHPADAVNMNLRQRLDIAAPHNENGERCPWPWEPEQLEDVPLGQYHCSYCGAMCLTGVRHPDYGETITLEPHSVQQGQKGGPHGIQDS